MKSGIVGRTGMIVAVFVHAVINKKLIRTSILDDIEFPVFRYS
jgi:hypothetical protein